MQFRKLIKADAADYWALRLEAIEREPRSFGPTPEEHRRITMDEIEALLCGPDSFVAGAFDVQTLVGFARFEREPYVKERHKGHVRGVYVAPSHRGQGVAKATIRYLVDEVRKDPVCEQLLLAVGLFNTSARKVYLDLGFVSFGVEPRSLRVEEDYIDEEHMIMRL